MVAAAVAGAAVVGGVAKGAIGSSAAGSAARAQEAQYQNAAQTEQKFYEGVQPSFQPYIDAGTNILPMMSAYPGQTQTALQGALDYQRGMMPNIPTEADVQNMPGWDFLKNQGLKAVQNSAAARGLGVSGAAMKGASTYATGLADTYWKDLFGARQTQFTDAGSLFTNAYNTQNLGFNQASTVGALGERAAGDLGSIGQKVYSSIGQDAIGYGNAASAGIAGQAKALGGAIDSITGAPATYAGAQNYFGTTPSPPINTTFNGYAPAIQPGTTNYLGTGFSTP